MKTSCFRLKVGAQLRSWRLLPPFTQISAFTGVLGHWRTRWSHPCGAPTWIRRLWIQKMTGAEGCYDEKPKNLCFFQECLFMFCQAQGRQQGERDGCDKIFVIQLGRHAVLVIQRCQNQPQKVQKEKVFKPTVKLLPSTRSIQYKESRYEE